MQGLWNILRTGGDDKGQTTNPIKMTGIALVLNRLLRAMPGSAGG
jgi:hypothetical protein